MADRAHGVGARAGRLLDAVRGHGGDGCVGVGVVVDVADGDVLLKKKKAKKSCFEF